MWIDDYELAEPPRSVAPLLQLQVLLRSGNQPFAWPWVFFWGFVLWLMVFLGGLQLGLELRFLLSSTSDSHGKIVACAGTNVEINGRSVNAFQFAFRDEAGREHLGTSYSTDSTKARGTKVKIKVLDSDPSKALIKGMRLSSLPALVLVFIGLFPAFGVLLILLGLKEGLRNRHLLLRGRLAMAQLLSKEATGTQINQKSVMKLSYSFVDREGRTRRFEHKSHEIEALIDDDAERILYDPQDPTRASFMDTLPGSGAVSPSGDFVLAEGAVAGLTWPALTLIVHGGLFVAALVAGYA